jgi:hypothetical protein
MRIVIVGPPKTGNTWLRTILVHTYYLRALETAERPERSDEGFRTWVEAGNFPDGTIFHDHFDYSPEFVDTARKASAHLLTVLRDPYDAFVSQYFYVNSGFVMKEPPGLLIDRPLDHPDVLAYLREGGFEKHLLRALTWLESGQSLVVRYEALHADPKGTMRAVTNAIQPVPDDRISVALALSSADNMRQWDDHMARFVRAARPGDARDKLSAEHLAIFRERYGDLIRALGYPVLDPADLTISPPPRRSRARRRGAQRDPSLITSDPGGGNA